MSKEAIMEKAKQSIVEADEDIAAFGRGARVHRDRHTVRYFEIASHAVLYSRRNRGGARRGERRPFCEIFKEILQRDAICRYHAQKADDESGGLSVWRNDGGKRRFENCFGKAF